MVMEGDLSWVGEHTVRCTDDTLWNCTPEAYIILLTSVTPINSIKKENLPSLKTVSHAPKNHGNDTLHFFFDTVHF